MKRSGFKAKWRPNKFRAVKTWCDGIKFDSKLEATRYQELVLLEKAGEISGLEIQRDFSLMVNGRQVCVIIPDFVYTERDKQIIEDAKGIETDAWRIKWKLLGILYPEFEYRVYKGAKGRGG